MQIEVIHNPDSLACKKSIKVINAAQAYKGLQKLMDSKRSRGMRLRFSYDLKTRMVFLEARNTLPIDIAKCYLSDAGFLRS